MTPTTTTPISLDELRKIRKERIWREGAAALLAAVRDLPNELPNDPRDLLRKVKKSCNGGLMP
jgi:DNA-binding GntR family transcriptional regulator